MSPVSAIAAGVYPRVGGGTALSSYPAYPPWGLSPRGRGNLKNDKLSQANQGSIPAWAGEPKGWRCAGPSGRVYPRVGGGTCPQATHSKRCPGLSPRGRGNLYEQLDWLETQGSIPAWAGEPPQAGSPHPMAGVYPRVGGGTTAGYALLVGFGGLSPRGRGNLVAVVEQIPAGGSIPAWAGEPRA